MPMGECRRNLTPLPNSDVAQFCPKFFINIITTILTFPTKMGENSAIFPLNTLIEGYSSVAPLIKNQLIIWR